MYGGSIRKLSQPEPWDCGPFAEIRFETVSFQPNKGDSNKAQLLLKVSCAETTSLTYSGPFYVAGCGSAG